MADIDFDNSEFATVCAVFRTSLLAASDDGQKPEPGTLFETYKKGGYPAVFKDCTKLGHAIGVKHDEPLAAPATSAKPGAATQR